ncbi:MAG: hypothetical protein K940chlam2_00839 [Chlamydiae bacterium]|nr:hypothetical protein [Chlamydiota bacterium]
MNIDFNRQQVLIIDETTYKDIADVTRALEGEERTGFGGLIKRAVAAIAGRYNTLRLEDAYTQFFKTRREEIKTLGPEKYKALKNVLSVRALSLTEIKGDKSGAYPRIMSQIGRAMP